jgi:Family of unknown function (DUF6093)
MSIDSALARGQLAAEARMRDTCLIERSTAGGTTDPETGYPTQAVTTVYQGKCEFKVDDVQAQQQDVGEDYVLLQRIELKLPMAVEGLEVNDRVTCLTSAYDPDLPDRVFLVRDLFHKSFATSRRVRLRERTD